ncbi:anthranilate synthase component II [Helicobacter canis]|uniref:Aminodeoxychorismate/anthranilate synthase component II n=1 Tax=Helicobacter canis TaxID=29419 RepID=A0A5M9QRB2_9HELI|nr:aminodeoxychorismate/anthranilate synthase component II [Helicobacter canis]KAA8709535.1 aminodeoxychorismate/anthranilate synthase component II [Helicobacter canis]
MILLLDNYDSFSYNLYQLLCAQGAHIEVHRNDKISLQDIQAKSPQAIIISPGPKAPKDAGICIDAIRAFAPHIPILGVCLGHQAICEAFGGKVGSAPKLMHGKQDTIEIDTASPLFANLPRHIEVARYHSLCALELGSELVALGKTLEIMGEADSMIMALAHKHYPTYGVQFHPESILTPKGAVIIQNFLAIAHKGI